jgi:7-carboxy-7-deazaguanine synthase
MKTEPFPVVELFDSIDGEGKRTGYMAIFVRFAGCNLRCSYCDTAYAWTAADAREQLTEEELLARIHAYPWKRITLTGGEPMLQPIEHLCRVLGSEGYDINIETNGAVPLFDVRPQGLFYTMDIKSPSSGEREKMHMENLKKLNADDVVKFVVGTEADLLDMEKILKAYPIPAQIYVSPVFGKIKPAQLVEFVRKHGLADVCVQVQLHKVIWDPERRGV